ncbi:DNA-3-methyladenine glycosylase [Microbispora sp. GKU 823]|nr:DNA-3-methyladenine glycosylase [Microbispora sp. GKU 823]
MGERELIEEVAGAPLDRDFFDRPSDVVAPDLLGRVVVHGSVACG